MHNTNDTNVFSNEPADGKTTLAASAAAAIQDALSEKTESKASALTDLGERSFAFPDAG